MGSSSAERVGSVVPVAPSGPKRKGGGGRGSGKPRRFHREQLMVALDLLRAEETASFAAMAGVSEETFDRWLDGLETPKETQLERMCRILHDQHRSCPLLEFFYTEWQPRIEPIIACRIDDLGIESRCETWEPDSPWSFSHWTEYPSFEPFGLADLKPFGGNVPPVTQEDFEAIRRQPEHAEQWRLLEAFAAQNGWTDGDCPLLEWIMRRLAPCGDR